MKTTAEKMAQERDKAAAAASARILELLHEAKADIVAASDWPADAGQSALVDMSAAKRRIDAATQKLRVADELIKNTDWPMPTADSGE